MKCAWMLTVMSALIGIAAFATAAHSPGEAHPVLTIIAGFGAVSSTFGILMMVAFSGSGRDEQ